MGDEHHELDLPPAPEPRTITPAPEDYANLPELPVARRLDCALRLRVLLPRGHGLARLGRPLTGIRGQTDSTSRDWNSGSDRFHLLRLEPGVRPA